MTTTALAGALLMAITASPATADTSALQPAIDNLLEAMQQAVVLDPALPFATPDSDATLLTDLQHTNENMSELVSATPRAALADLSALLVPADFSARERSVHRTSLRN